MLPRGKVPVICVIIDSLSVHSADASVVLRDQSGMFLIFVWGLDNVAFKILTCCFSNTRVDVICHENIRILFFLINHV